MKQNITKEQWDELSKKKQDRLFREINDLWSSDITLGWYPNLGQIIEFLGDDIESITLMNGHWTLILTDETHFTDKEIIDVGWEAAKYKANK